MKITRLLSPDPIEGGSPETLGSPEAESYNPFAEETPSVEQQTPAVTPAAVQPAAVAPLQITQEQLKELVHGVAGAVKPAQAEQQAMSQEEFNKTFNVIRVNPDMLRSMGIPITEENMAQVQEQFDNYGQGLVRQALTMANYAIQAKLGALEQQYQPIMEHFKGQQEQVLAKEFLAQNTDLQGWEPLLWEIKDRLVAEGYRANSKEELFKTVADRARGIVAKIGKQNGQPQQQTTPQGAAKPRMSTVSTGGQGGAGTASGRQSSGTAKSLWG